jgi:hypothetical protein
MSTAASSGAMELALGTDPDAPSAYGGAVDSVLPEDCS